MIENPAERLRLTLTGRDITIPVSHADEHRLRLWVDRYNTATRKHPGCSDADLMDDTDEGLATAILCCMTEGLRRDEGEHGLEGFAWGDVVSTEQADEMRRRRA